MLKKYVLSIDQGTTSSRAVLFDKLGGIAAQVSRRHEQIYDNGWVSHNAKEIFFNVAEAGKQAITQAGTAASEIAAVGITNQRETTIAWDKTTGEPVCDAVVWQCKRTSGICEELKKNGAELLVREKTGLVIDPYFSATKMKWILDNVPQAAALLSRGRLAFGTVDSYIIYRLTGGRNYVTDYTNASRTALFNIHTLKWDSELLDIFGLPGELLENGALPSVVPSSGDGFAGVTDGDIFGKEIPITGIAGDQHAALFGQACFERNGVKSTYGTGCFILANTGDNPLGSDKGKGLLSTIAWHIGGKTAYAAEGSIFSAGSAIEWLINGINIISGVPELEYILGNTRDSGGVYFVPAFSGLGAPKWDMGARGALFGLTLGSGKEQIVRAVCESIAFSVRDALNYISGAAGINIEKLSVDGGVSRNNAIMQFQADMLNIPVARPENIETTALGAAGLAGLATGFYEDLEEIRTLKGGETVFYPKMTDEVRARHREMWGKALRRAGGWI